MKKRVLSLFLALVFCLMPLPTSAFAEALNGADAIIQAQSETTVPAALEDGKMSDNSGLGSDDENPSGGVLVKDKTTISGGFVVPFEQNETGSSHHPRQGQRPCG